MAVYSRRLPKPDDRGRIRPYVGVSPDGRPVKIEVGNRNVSVAEAERRLDLVRTIYKRQTERRRIERWDAWSLNIARRIGQGEPITFTWLAGPHEHDRATAEDGAASEIKLLASWGVPVVIDEEAAFAKAVGRRVGYIDDQVAKVVQETRDELTKMHGAIVADWEAPRDLPALTEDRTFYDGLTHFEAYLRATAKRNADGSINYAAFKIPGHLNSIRERIPDFPLRRLDYLKWTEIFTVWRNRPETWKGTRAKESWARDIIKSLDRFADWLHLEPSFKWRKPDGFDSIDRRVITLPSDREPTSFDTIHKPTYSSKELATILKYANREWRAAIALSVNCAFGASELAQLPTTGFAFKRRHKFADKLGFESDASDSWLIGERPKTGRYFEHLLWEEVADAVRPLVDTGRTFYFVNGQGNPYWNPAAKNPRSQLDNRWRKLLARVREDHPEFPVLPFGSLRDVLPDILATEYDETLASLKTAHQTYTKDKLLQSYANFPWARMFVATRELRKRFAPMLKELKVDRVEL